MRRLVACSVAMTLLSGTLAGCGQAGPGAPGLARKAATLRARAAEGSPARQFYQRMKGTYAGEVKLEGDLVTLAYPDQPVAVYDFSAVAATGRVKVTIGEFELDMSLAELMTAAPDDGTGVEVLPALVVPIALDMAAAGAQALVIYWLGHRGEDFDRGDAAKAVALAMALAIVPFLGEMSALSHVLPVAAKLVASCPSFAARDVMRAAAALSGEIIDLVKALYKIYKKKKA